MRVGFGGPSVVLLEFGEIFQCHHFLEDEKEVNMIEIFQ
jgi:hypothetical protein